MNEQFIDENQRKTSNGHAGPERDTNTHPVKHKKRHSENNRQVRTTVTNNKGAKTIIKINHQNQRQ